MLKEQIKEVLHETLINESAEVLDALATRLVEVSARWYMEGIGTAIAKVINEMIKEE